MLWKTETPRAASYQTRMTPATAATDVHHASNAKRRSFMNPPLRGTNGTGDVIPLRGTYKGAWDDSSGPRTRIVASQSSPPC